MNLGEEIGSFDFLEYVCSFMLLVFFLDIFFSSKLMWVREGIIGLWNDFVLGIFDLGLMA
jgi:hypothetical protein